MKKTGSYIASFKFSASTDIQRQLVSYLVVRRDTLFRHLIADLFAEMAQTLVGANGLLLALVLVVGIVIDRIDNTSIVATGSLVALALFRRAGLR